MILKLLIDSKQCQIFDVSKLLKHVILHKLSRNSYLSIYCHSGMVDKMIIPFLVTRQSYLSGFPRLRINVWAYFGGFFLAQLKHLCVDIYAWWPFCGLPRESPVCSFTLPDIFYFHNNFWQQIKQIKLPVENTKCAVNTKSCWIWGLSWCDDSPLNRTRDNSVPQTDWTTILTTGFRFSHAGLSVDSKVNPLFLRLICANCITYLNIWVLSCFYYLSSRPQL